MHSFCMHAFSVWMLPPIQLVLKTAAAMPLDACRPVYFYTHGPRPPMPVGLHRCRCPSDPVSADVLSVCPSPCVCVGGCTHIGIGHACGV